MLIEMKRRGIVGNMRKRIRNEELREFVQNSI